MEKYNWWDDPKNAEEVKRVSWWEKPENKTTLEIPVSIVSDGDHWCVGTNKQTKALIGEGLGGISASGDTKEEAIKNFFELLKMSYEFEEMCRIKYQRWVPFKKGPWSHIGGRWFTIFGIGFHFRKGKNMKGGWYIPFTKLNISISSEWSIYKRWKNKTNE